jgi:hypothetical protein
VPASSRNPALLKILEDAPLEPGRTVCENRGSGIVRMRAVLTEAGMEPPAFDDRVATFTVTFPNHALLDEATQSWLGGLDVAGLSRAQLTALARARRGEILTNVGYRVVTGVADSRAATAHTGCFGRLAITLSCHRRCSDEGDWAWAEGPGGLRHRLHEIEDLIAEAAAFDPGLAIWKPVLARLHLELGRREQAAEILDHFAAAATTHERIAAPIWLARPASNGPACSCAGRRSDDADQARRLLGQALVTARDLGLANIERQAVALLH